MPCDSGRSIGRSCIVRRRCWPRRAQLRAIGTRRRSASVASKCAARLCCSTVKPVRLGGGNRVSDHPRFGLIEPRRGRRAGPATHEGCGHGAAAHQPLCGAARAARRGGPYGGARHRRGGQLESPAFAARFARDARGLPAPDTRDDRTRLEPSVGRRLERRQRVRVGHAFGRALDQGHGGLRPRPRSVTANHLRELPRVSPRPCAAGGRGFERGGLRQHQHLCGARERGGGARPRAQPLARSADLRQRVRLACRQGEGRSAPPALLRKHGRGFSHETLDRRRLDLDVQRLHQPVSGYGAERLPPVGTRRARSHAAGVVRNRAPAVRGGSPRSRRAGRLRRRTSAHCARRS